MADNLGNNDNIFVDFDCQNIVLVDPNKTQNVDGSVETKLWSGPSLKREYELILGDGFKIFYGFCVSVFLEKKFTSTDKKFITLNQILSENDISVLFGDNQNYFETLDLWLNNSL
jgi:hypothetical protein